MEEVGKMKVALICHFSNKEVRNHLPLSKGRLYRLVRKILRLPEKREGYGDIAPWDSNMINAIKERDDIDLTVISAHGGLKKPVVSFDSDKIHYHFIRCDFSTFLKHIIPNDSLWRKLNPITPKVLRIIHDVNPDIVVLAGAENAHYSSTILGLDGYPIYVLCQTVYNDPSFKATGSWESKNGTTELEILKKTQYVGVNCEKHGLALRELGYKGNVFRFDWPVVSKPTFSPKPVEHKEFDFINFALSMSEQKGYHDCIKALAIVKQKYPHVRLDLVDGGPATVKSELMQLITENGLEENVTFTPFFENRNDLFQHLQLVRFAVLPCKLDNISGTQLQSMKFGLPVVCYKTDGTPSLNKDKECVLIAEMNDVDDLAKKMIILMENSQKEEELRNNALDYFAKRRAKALENLPRLIENFYAIIGNYRSGEIIPKEQLF